MWDPYKFTLELSRYIQIRNHISILKGSLQHLDTTTVRRNLDCSRIFPKISFPQINTTTKTPLRSFGSPVLHTLLRTNDVTDRTAHSLPYWWCDRSILHICILRLGSNGRTLLVQHDVTVDHTMLSGVAKLSNLRCSTMCDTVCWTMLKGYVKLTYICWTTNQIYIVIIFSQLFIWKDSSVGSTLAS